MNMRKAALVAEIVGGIGVIISLLFVGFQVRAEAEAQQAQSVLQLRLALGEIQRTFTASSEATAFVYRGHWDPQSLDEIEQYRYQQIVGNTLNTYAIAFEYGTLGRVDAEEFAAWERGICALVQRPGFRIVYDEWPMLTDDFRRWVTDSCTDTAG